MKKIKPRLKNFSVRYPELIINAVLVVIVALRHDMIFLSLGLVVFLCIQSLMLFVRSDAIKKYKKLKRAEQVSQKRLELIRELITILYTYDSRDELLEKKMRKAVHVQKIIDRDVINRESILRGGRRRSRAMNMTDEEADFYCLLKSGFSITELSVIYNVPNHKSLYVRKHRVLKKAGSNVQ